jgi:hypothetical protein
VFGGRRKLKVERGRGGLNKTREIQDVSGGLFIANNRPSLKRCPDTGTTHQDLAPESVHSKTEFPPSYVLIKYNTLYLQRQLWDDLLVSHCLAASTLPTLSKCLL